MSAAAAVLDALEPIAVVRLERLDNLCWQVSPRRVRLIVRLLPRSPDAAPGFLPVGPPRVPGARIGKTQRTDHRWKHQLMFPSVIRALGSRPCGAPGTRGGPTGRSRGAASGDRGGNRTIKRTRRGASPAGRDCRAAPDALPRSAQATSSTAATALIDNSIEDHYEIEVLLISAERSLINDLYRDGQLKDEARRRIERELIYAKRISRICDLIG